MNKEVWRKIISIITIILVVITVFVMVFTIVSMHTVGKDNRGVFGYKLNSVVTQSMEPTIDKGDIVITENVTYVPEGATVIDEDPDAVRAEDLKVGDIITFYSTEPAIYGQLNTHRIMEITTDEDGNLAFVTKGDNNPIEDSELALATNVYGRYAGTIPFLGSLFEFIKDESGIGYFTIILIPFLLLIVIQVVKFIKLMRKYRKEQQELLDEQRAEMETERQKAQDMMEELARLRAQMGVETQEVPPVDQSEQPAEETSAPAQESAADEVVVEEDTQE
ncbi:MAG: signal peptidase I [Clostridia bacterium]|nr:signal peptidase I [Clostridia bacterium]